MPAKRKRPVKKKAAKSRSKAKPRARASSSRKKKSAVAANQPRQMALPVAAPPPEKTKKATSSSGKGNRKEATAHKVDKKSPKKSTPSKSTRMRKETVPRRRDARELAGHQREISVAEFFTKNRHLLGFDNPKRALLAAVKEAVDNSLDACEEAGILPEIRVYLTHVSEGRLRVRVDDNGPGIIKREIPNIFGKLLYGSKFHRLKQTRGQQGIGISAAAMYGQMTTGKPVEITSKTKRGAPAHHCKILIDTRKNQPRVVEEGDVDWPDWDHGTRVEIEMDGRYQKGRQSVDEYLARTALANPHVQISYTRMDGSAEEYPRVSEEMPPDPREVKPHPYGVELGIFMRMLRDSRSRNVKSFLQNEFTRVSDRVATQILDAAAIPANRRPSKLSSTHMEQIFHAIAKTKIMAPPTDCLAPIGEEKIQASLEERIPADFYSTRTRAPVVYRGNPFQVEVGLAYGGELQAEESVTLYRYANRVPLMFQQSSCAVTDAILSVDWRSYGLQQSRGGQPFGPAAVFVHMASVWVPFTSESKEAIADYEEIVKEIRLGLQECGRKLASHVRRKRKEAEYLRKRSHIEKYLPHIGIALQEILDLSDPQVDKLSAKLKRMLEKSRKP